MCASAGTSYILYYILNLNCFCFILALSKYFESMPLPNAISWNAHYFPVWFLKTITVFAEINDLFVPLLFLVPIRSIKKLAFYIQVMFYCLF